MRPSDSDPRRRLSLLCYFMVLTLVNGAGDLDSDLAHLSALALGDPLAWILRSTWVGADRVFPVGGGLQHPPLASAVLFRKGGEALRV